MLCAGELADASMTTEALKYFAEFWCSDNTDPIERIYTVGILTVFRQRPWRPTSSWNRNASDEIPRTDA